MKVNALQEIDIILDAYNTSNLSPVNMRRRCFGIFVRDGLMTREEASDRIRFLESPKTPKSPAPHKTTTKKKPKAKPKPKTSKQTQRTQRTDKGE